MYEVYVFTMFMGEADTYEDAKLAAAQLSTEYAGIDVFIDHRGVRNCVARFRSGHMVSEKPATVSADS